MGCKQFEASLAGILGGDDAEDAWAAAQASSESLRRGHYLIHSPVFLLPEQTIWETVSLVLSSPGGLIKSTFTFRSAETRGVLLSQTSVTFYIYKVHNTAGTFM